MGLALFTIIFVCIIAAACLLGERMSIKLIDKTISWWEEKK